MTTREQLITAVTQYDFKQSKKRGYNVHALNIYFNRVDAIMKDIDAGADVRDAIVAGFAGTLLTHVLRSLKLEKATKDEISGADSIVYCPVALKN